MLLMMMLRILLTSTAEFWVSPSKVMLCQKIDDSIWDNESGIELNGLLWQVWAVHPCLVQLTILMCSFELQMI